jgi:hypothetical protein
MSFAKFIDLLKTQSLYFTCIKKLKDQDKNEGLLDPTSFPFRGLPQEKTILEQLRTVIGEPTWQAAGNPTDLTFLFKALAESEHDRYFANCWHMANHESILMWNRYAPGFESVAIQSTVGKLLSSVQEDCVMRYGAVNYDPKTMGIQYGNSSECFYKHPLYIGENECRFLAYSAEPTSIGIGMHLHVNLNPMIERVYVAPDCEPWFLSLVETLANQAGLPTPVVRTTTKP